jgi:hypothetical protein
MASQLTMDTATTRRSSTGDPSVPAAPVMPAGAEVHPLAAHNRVTMTAWEVRASLIAYRDLAN